METKVLRSAIQTYPIIFWIPTHDSTLLSNKARMFACSNRLFVVDMAGVEQGNVSSEEFMEEVARYECVYHRNSKDFKDKNKKANCCKNILRTQKRCFLRFWSWWWRHLRTKRRNKCACSKISSSTSAMLFAAIFPPAQRACNFWHFRWPNSRLCDRLRSSAIIWKQLSLRSSAICDLRSAIVCDRLRSPAIIWKPAFNANNGMKLLSRYSR